MICRNCGAEIHNTMKFCNKCGSRIALSHEIDPANFATQDISENPTPATAHNREQITSHPPAINTSSKKPTASQNSSRRGNEKSGRYATSSQNAGQSTLSPKRKNSEKNKFIAGILGVFLGYFGVHWFYLGKKLRGALFLAISFLMATINEDILVGFAVFCICEGIYFLFAHPKSFKKYCTVPFKSIAFYIFLVISLLFSLSSESAENGSSESANAVTSETSSPSQPDLNAANVTSDPSEIMQTENTPTVATTDAYIPTATDVIETEATAIPTAPPTTTEFTEPMSELSYSLNFIEKQAEYAANYGIELHRFPVEESNLAYWIENSDEKLVYVDTDNFLGSDQYKITESYEGYLYYGELKDNRPSGYGILLAYTENSDYLLSYKERPYALRYVGEFSGGQFDGFGLLFTESETGRNFLSDLRPYNIETKENLDLYFAWANYVEYFGEFSDGYKDGKGNSFVLADFYIGLYGKALEEIDIEHPSFSIDVGRYKNDELNGSNKQYVGGYLLYDGECKEGKYDGYGILYHYGTNIPQYEGDFKNGMRHGTGTSYTETGEVVYEGKWKNDDYA